MTPLILIIACLACYRISLLITRDAGPWDVFKKLRETDRYSKLLKCIRCTSVWCGALIETALYLSGIRDVPAVAVCNALAMSAFTIAADRVFTYAEA